MRYGVPPAEYHVPGAPWPKTPTMMFFDALLRAADSAEHCCLDDLLTAGLAAYAGLA